MCKDKGPTLETDDAEPAAWFKARKPELKARFDKMLKSLEEKGFVDKDILPVLKALEQAFNELFAGADNSAIGNLVADDIAPADTMWFRGAFVRGGNGFPNVI